MLDNIWGADITGLSGGDLRKASIQTLRFRHVEAPGQAAHGQRRTWLDLPCPPTGPRPPT
jgi:hypothetical protein